MKSVITGFLIVLTFHFNNAVTAQPAAPRIFPFPSEVISTGTDFLIEDSTIIIVPVNATDTDHFLSRMISDEVAYKYECRTIIQKNKIYPSARKFILAGAISNPLVKKFCESNNLMPDLKGLGEEGYILKVSGSNIVIAANTANGALFGVQSLRQIIYRDGEKLLVHGVTVKDMPQFAFRGIKLYLPGRENIVFFRRFIKDFASLYKFNKIILELNANMRLEKHPELNIGAVEFNRYLNMNRLERPAGIHKEFQNSSHQDNADGGILEKEEVADLVAWMRKFNMEVIPEIPSLTHAYYLMPGHEELAENLQQPFPDTYCPLKPEVYDLYFDVLDEYIEVIRPDIIHVGHDEWRVEKDLCELCRGKDYGELFADDLTKIHDYLAEKGIRTAIWGDHLLESVRKKDYQEWKTSTGYTYKIPGALTPEQVISSIPKDILIFNWFWSDIGNDNQVSDFGFEQVYGNLTPEIGSWNERVAVKGLLGGAPSSWAATTERNFGKDQIFDFLGTANLLWTEHHIKPEELPSMVQSMIPEIRRNLSGKVPPSEYSGHISHVDLSSNVNSSLPGRKYIVTGTLKYKNIPFSIASTDVKAVASTGETPVKAISIGKDVNSLLFLHACTYQGKNDMAYRIIHNFDETSELLGWYEVVFEDGFIETIPLRYGINILDWKWEQRVKTAEKAGSQKYVYEADAVNCSTDNSNPLTFFVFEWANTRPGKPIHEIILRSVEDSRNKNSIMLLGISAAETGQSRK